MYFFATLVYTNKAIAVLYSILQVKKMISNADWNKLSYENNRKLHKMTQIFDYP
jgi:hypothetical protein